MKARILSKNVDFGITYFFMRKYILILFVQHRVKIEIMVYSALFHESSGPVLKLAFIFFYFLAIKMCNNNWIQWNSE